MTLLEKIAERWDLDPHARTALPFPEAIALLNVKRIELTCILSLVSNTIEFLQGHTQTALRFEIPGAIVIIALAWWLRGVRGPHSARLQQIAVVVFIVAALLSTQWAIHELAAQGRIFSGYLVRLLTITLLFVLPPRVLTNLLLFLLAVYAGVIGSLEVPHPIERLNAILGAITVTAIAQVTGWLIFNVRRSDHQQRVLIELQNAKLEAQNAELDQLMAIAAHDLRSPLHGLRNLFDLASRRAAQDPALPLRVLKDGITSLDAMLALVNRLLQAHQAEHGPLAAVVEGDLRAQLQAAARRIAPLAEAQGVTVELSLPDAPLPARFDAGALAQILDNLLANGVRFTPADQPLRLSASASVVAGQAVLAVEDCGPGIDPALQPALFGRFQRGIHAQDGAGAGAGLGGKTGTGMGLFIAATYAARIGASLSYRPASPRGAVFELSLPLARS